LIFVFDARPICLSVFTAVLLIDWLMWQTAVGLTMNEEILNLQPKRDKAKAYQVKQVRNIIFRYKLADEGDDE
jgi:hypothetical protein